MLTTVFATKIGMTQAWTKQGKRVAVTRCQVDPNMIVGQVTLRPKQNLSDVAIFEIGYGTKKIKNMSKPLRSKLEKGGFSKGVKQIQGLRVPAAKDGEESLLKVGQTFGASDVLTVGDIVKVQGTSKGRGFAGAMKRHGFAGGPQTHGQSDRARAVGSIGSGTTPGRVNKGKKMAGHFGVETVTVDGLIVLHVNPVTQEVWLSGPVPGHIQSFVRIEKTGKTKAVELVLPEADVAEVEAEVPAETETVAVEAVAAEVAEGSQE
jgi:large subunit ribosomal protein L3